MWGRAKLQGPGAHEPVAGRGGEREGPQKGLVVGGWGMGPYGTRTLGVGPRVNPICRLSPPLGSLWLGSGQPSPNPHPTSY